MKFSSIFLLFVCASSTVYAQSQKVTSTQVLNSINELQNEVAKLKSRVTNLEKHQAKLENSHTANTPTVAVTDDEVVDLKVKTNLGEKKQYDNAMALFKKGSINQAISAFQSIINTYPDGEYADNSQYWIGESLLKKGEKQNAMRAFDRVLQDYPQSAKVPDALLKLGMTQASLGNSSKAKEYYDYLIENYPSSTSANIAYTKRRQLGF